MFDDIGLGGFVGVLGSSGLLRIILSFCLVITVFACAEPDERLPWPTITVPAGRFESPCEKKTSTEVHYFVIDVNDNGSFSVTERIFRGSCTEDFKNRILHDIRERKGQITSAEDLGHSVWKISAQMKSPFYLGDLISTDVILKMVDGKAHVKPQCAELHNIGEDNHRIWTEDSPDEWILTPLD